MALSDVIANSFEGLWNLPQRADFHFERNVGAHQAYVCHELKEWTENGSREQLELLMVGAFHDLGKISTTDRKSEENGGYITSYGHAEKSTVYWDAVAEALTKDTNLRSDVIRWLIKEHMNLKFSDRMNDRKLHEKKKEAQALGDRVWTMGQLFKEADDMPAFFDRHGLDYREDVDPSDDHLEPLDRHEEAIEFFEGVVESIINNIRSWEDQGDGSKELIIIRGVPGAGKSTFADSISGPHGEVFESDDYFYEHGEGSGYDFDPSKLGEAHEWCRSRVESAMRDRGVQRVIVANSSSRVWEFLSYVSMAGKYGYRVNSLIKENRHRGTSTKSVPQNTVNKMKDRFEIRL